MTILLTLEIEGGNLGPFNLYSNTDGYTNPFATNITKAALEAGYTSTSVPPNTTTVQVKSVGNCSNSIDIVLQNIIVPCNGTSDSGGFGLKDLSVDLDPAGGVITFLFDPQGAADKMEFYHGLPQDDGINKVATTSQSAPGEFGGNYGPFDDEYGTPPAPIIFPNNPTTDVDQFIGTFKDPVPTRQSQYTSDTGCTIPSMTIGGITYDQIVWWKYDAADYLANPVVTIRITGSGDNTLWNLVRICNVCATTTTTSSSTSTSTSTSTSSTTTTTTEPPQINSLTGIIINDPEDSGKVTYSPSYNYTSHLPLGDWYYNSGVILTVQQPSLFQTNVTSLYDYSSPQVNDMVMLRQDFQSFLPNDIVFDPALGNKMWYLISLVEYTSAQIATILANATEIQNIQLLPGSPPTWEGDSFLYDVDPAQSSYTYLIWDYRKTITTTTTTTTL